MPLTLEQRQIIEDVKTTLETSGILSLSQIPTDVFAASLQTLSVDGGQPFSFISSSLHYIPPNAVFGSRLMVTRKNSSAVDAIVEHPISSIVEYPETGSQPGESVAHRFVIDPHNYVNPCLNMQYSVGPPEGAHPNTTCRLISRGMEPNMKVLCEQKKISCKLVYLLRISTS